MADSARVDRVFRRVHERASRTIAELAEPLHGGSARDPEDGVELLRRLPAIADDVYRDTGLEGLESFPPEPKGAPGSDAHPFAAEVPAHLDREWWSDTIFAAGLAVLAVAVTVASMGTLGPFAAAALGRGALSGFAEHVVRERVVPTRPTSGRCATSTTIGLRSSSSATASRVVSSAGPRVAAPPAPMGVRTCGAPSGPNART